MLFLQPLLTALLLILSAANVSADVAKRAATTPTVYTMSVVGQGIPSSATSGADAIQTNTQSLVTMSALPMTGTGSLGTTVSSLASVASSLKASSTSTGKWSNQ